MELKKDQLCHWSNSNTLWCNHGKVATKQFT